MVLTDIWYNADHVELQHIIGRHKVKGGIDLSKIPSRPDKVWKREMATARWQMFQSKKEEIKQTILC